MFNIGFFTHYWSTLKKLIWLKAAALSKAVLKIVRGNPIHILDALAKPAQALSIALEPIQNLNGYDNPWPSGGGVNKLIECVPGTYTGTNCQAVVSADGTITVSGTTGDSSDTINIPLKAKITVPSEQFYVHMFNTSNAYIAPSFELSTNVAGTTINAACSPANRIFAVPTNRLGVEIDRVRFWIGANVNAACTLHPMFALTDSVIPWTPYSNICPISGHTDADVTRTGKNIVHITAVNSSASGISWAMNSDGTVTADGTASAFAGKTIADVNLKAGVTYHLSGGVSGKVNFYLYKSGRGVLRTDTGSGANYTPEKDISGVNVYFSVSGGVTVDNLTLYPQIEVGNSGSEWGTYQGQTYPIPLGQTVYGGTLDVLTGVLTVDRATHICDGTEVVIASSSTSGFMTIPSNQNTFMSVFNITDTEKPVPVCSHYKGVEYSYSTSLNIGDCDTYPGASGKTIGFKTSFASASEFSAWLAGQYSADTPMQFVLPLATPITIQLTPQQVELLQGENNLFSDGEMTLVYLADGNASDVEALNILLGGRYVNNHGEDEPTDREALDILLGGNTR